MPLERWMSTLLSQLGDSRQRQLLLLQGPRDWCGEQLGSMVTLDPGMLLLSNR